MAETPMEVANRGVADESGDYGWWPGHTPQAAHKQSAEAYDPHRGRAVHGAHRQPPQGAWFHRYRRDAAIHARGDTRLLRRWLGLGCIHELLRGGRPGGYRRLRQARRRAVG